jgi:GNAT superfamily N-acetyltransferase
MTSEILLSEELARRIELAEAQAAVEAAMMLKQTRPESGAAVESIAGGFAVYCGANSPITQAVGLGLSGPVNEEEFDKLESFYKSRQEPVRVETCPLADASLIEQFGKHGYRVTEFSNVMVRSIRRNDSANNVPAFAPGIAIERAGGEQIDLWTLTVAQGFSENAPVPQELFEVMKIFAQTPGAECYLARVDGKVAGGGTLAVRDGIAGLFGASTLPEFRKRGVQTALLRARLARAAEAGCEIAACLALPGSVSQRNLTRRGFLTLYTRVKFEKAWGI